jgi:hypothetical protein
LAYRVRIRHLMLAVIVVAIPLAVLAPLLRAWDRVAWSLVVGIPLYLTAGLMCFLPVWLVMFYIRYQGRRGAKVGRLGYVLLDGAYLASFGILIALLLSWGLV